MSYPAIPARVATSRTTGRGGHTRPARKPTSATPHADSGIATPTHSRRRRLSHHSQSKHDKSSHSARASRRHSVTKSTTNAEHARTTVKGSPTWTTHGVTGSATHATRNTTTTAADAAAATGKEDSHEDAKQQQQQQSITNAQTVTRSEKITLPLSVLVLSNRFAVHHPYSLKALGEASQATQVNTRDKAQRVGGATTLPTATAPLHESGHGLQERSSAQEPSHAESASYVENNNNSNTVNAMPASALGIDDDAAHEPQPRQVHIVPQKHALLTSQAMPSAASHDNLSAAPSYGLVSAINEANSTDCAVATMNANPRPMLLSAGSLARPSPTPRRTSLPREQANHIITVDETKKKSKGRSASRVPSLSSASRTSPPRLLAPPTTLSETTQFIQRMDYELALLERRHLEQRALHGLPEPRRSRSRCAHSQQQQQQQHSHLNPVQTARSGRSAGSTSGRLRRRQDSTQRPSTARTPVHEAPTTSKLRRSDAAPHIVIGTAEQTASKGTRRHLCTPALSGRRTTASTSSRRSASSQQQQHSPSTPPRQTMSYTMLAHTAKAPLGKGSLTANNSDTTAAGNVSHHLLLHHHRRPLLPSHKASMNSPNKQSGSAMTNERHRVERTATAKPSCVAAGEVACHGPPPVSDDDEDEDEEDEVVVETGSAVREASPMTKVSTATAASEIASATRNGIDEEGVTHDGGINAMSGNGAAVVMNEEDVAAAALRTPPHKALSEANSETNTMPYRGSTGRRPERMLEEDMEEVHQDTQAHVALEE